MRKPQYRLETTDPDVKNKVNGTITDTSRMASNYNITKDQYLKDLKSQSKKSLIPPPPPPPQASSAEDLIVHELDSSPVVPAFEGSCYPKEIDKAIQNAMFIAAHIGENCYI